MVPDPNAFEIVLFSYRLSREHCGLFYFIIICFESVLGRENSGKVCEKIVRQIVLCVLLVSVCQEMLISLDFLKNKMKSRTLESRNLSIEIPKITPHEILPRQNREIKYRQG